MKITIENLDYPALRVIPDYQAEAEKLARFRVELDKAEARNIELHAAWMAEQQSRPHMSDAERIAEAETLLSGKPVLDLQEQIKQNMALADSLRRAIDAQVIVVRDMGRALSRKAAERFATEHKTRTKRVVDALLELHAANQAETSLRESLAALGYEDALPCMRFEHHDHSLDPHDVFGGYAPAWYQHACEYLTTEEERADRAERQAVEGRRKRLASLSAA